MIDILPLTEENVEEAVRVLDVEFGKDSPNPSDPESFDAYQKWLPGSLPRGFNGEGLKAENGVDYVKFWVAFDPEHKKVVGVTGVYTKKSQPDRAWLGWTGMLRDDSRSADSWDNLEYNLIHTILGIARSIGKRYLSGYVTDSPEDKGIVEFFEKYHFTCYDREEAPEGEKSLFYEYDLRFMEAA